MLWWMLHEQYGEKAIVFFYWLFVTFPSAALDYHEYSSIYLNKD